MRPIPSSAMAAATRLTREGRLDEATALLRGALTPPVAGQPPGSGGPGAGAHRARDAMTIDLDPPSPATGGAWRLAPDAGGEPAQGRPDLATTLAGALRGIGARHAGRGAPGADAAPEPLPAGARFEERLHRGATGVRPYRLYVPRAAADGRALPLLVMLHGCTQGALDFAAGTRMNALAEEAGILVAYPEQTQAANAQRCWNWFSPADQQRGAGEPALIAGIAAEVMGAFAVPKGRVFVAGLSAGGAAAAVVGSAYPDLFAGVGVHSGLACGAARDVPSAFAAMRQGGGRVAGRGHGLPTIVFHGDRDATVHRVNGDEVAAQAGGGAGLRAETLRGRSAGGMDFTRTVHRDEGGTALLEQWVLHGAGHTWSGGSPAGSYTDPRGPDASREMLRFFLDRPAAAGR